jgi:hypothetical protein
MVIAAATSSGSERISTTSAVSTATSVPVPIASPTSACARAGAVVDAVADHRDLPALLLELGDLPGLVAGKDLRDHSSMPISAATRSPVA